MRVEVNDLVFSINTTQKYATVVSDQHCHRDYICIPEIVNGYPVKFIDPFAFRESAYLRSVEIPNSVIKIKTSAFANCYGLKKVYFYKTAIPARELTVDDHAFWGCWSLKEFLAGEDVSIVCGLEAFKGCRNLEVIQGCLYNLNNRSFENCFKLNNLIFAPNAWWKTETFKGCTVLKNLTFLGDVEELLPNTCMKWISHRKIKCRTNTSLAELIYAGTNVEFTDSVSI